MTLDNNLLINLNDINQLNRSHVLSKMINYMHENKIFNTYIITEDEHSIFSIILRNKNNKKTLLNHLNDPVKIKKNDPIINSDDHCSICLDNYCFRQNTRKLNCNHLFHQKCIDKWLIKNKENMHCPICRSFHKREIFLN